MPRRIRYILPDVPHHALQRGNNRQIVFTQKSDYEFFLRYLKEYATENSVRTGAYCLMRNHIHLMIFPGTHEGAIRLMKSLLQKYSQYFNRKYKRTGKLWENRYKLNIVEPEAAWVIARYIDRNPLRAGIVEKPEDYDYSSALAHLTGIEDSILTEDVIKTRRKEYRDFFYEKEANAEESLNRIRTVVQQQRAFGGANFLEQLRKTFKVDFETKHRGRPKFLN